MLINQNIDSNNEEVPADFFEKGNKPLMVPRSTLVEIGRDETKKCITIVMKIHLVWDITMSSIMFLYWVHYLHDGDDDMTARREVG